MQGDARIQSSVTRALLTARATNVARSPHNSIIDVLKLEILSPL